MKWFGRKAASVGARPVLLRHSLAPGAGDWPRSYEAQVREAYLGNPVAQRAVRLVAEGCAGAVLYGAKEEKDSPSTGSGRAASLTSPPLLEAVASHLLLHGNAYVQVLPDAEGMPAELFALRPERVAVEADAKGWPVAYAYRAGAAKTRIAARDGLGRPGVVHLKAMHPLDDHYGLGCLGAAAGAVAIHNAATKWNKALLDNAARPSGALSFEAGDGSALSPEQIERLRGRRGTEWAAAEHRAGEVFALIEPEALVVVEPPAALAGGEARLLAVGIGDGPEGVETTRSIVGEAARPPSPVHLSAAPLANGDIVMSWVRRSRSGWAWLSGGDTPLGEEHEKYRLLLAGGGSARELILGAPSYLYSAAEQAEDGFVGAFEIEVTQLGTVAASRPARISFSEEI